MRWRRAATEFFDRIECRAGVAREVHEPAPRAETIGHRGLEPARDVLVLPRALVEHEMVAFERHRPRHQELGALIAARELPQLFRARRGGRESYGLIAQLGADVDAHGARGRIAVFQELDRDRETGDGIPGGPRRLERERAAHESERE